VNLLLKKSGVLGDILGDFVNPTLVIVAVSVEIGAFSLK
jgi:hypothetical protein